MERMWLSRLWRRSRPTDRWPGKASPDIDILFETGHCGMVLLEDGIMVRVNPAFADLLGCPPGELLGCPFQQLVEEDIAWQRLASTADETTEGMVTLRSCDGLTQRRISLRMRRLESCVNSHPLFLVSIEDVTHLHHSERALRDHARRLRILARQVIEVQEQERRHLARELHDEIGQQLTMIRMGLERLRTAALEPSSEALLATAVDQVADLTAQVRSLSLDLRPSMLDDLGLAPVLRWYATRTAALADLELELQLDEEFPRLEAEIETTFFRIAQEAMNNLLKHGNAHRLEVSLSMTENAVLLVVRDDGKGFAVKDVGDAAASGNGAGLLGMQERAALIGGQLELQSEPGQGCTVRLHLPIADRQL